MRLILVTLCLLLAGCSGSSDDANPVEGDTPTQEVEDAVNETAACNPRCGNELVHPNQTIEIRESGEATNGYDEEFFWSVHPGASETSIFVGLTGPQGVPAALGSWGYELTGPGVDEKSPCPGSGTIGSNTSIGQNGVVIVEKDSMDVGNWRLRVCLAQSVADYDIQVDVLY